VSVFDAEVLFELPDVSGPFSCSVEIRSLDLEDRIPTPPPFGVADGVTVFVVLFASEPEATNVATRLTPHDRCDVDDSGIVRRAPHALGNCCHRRGVGRFVFAFRTEFILRCRGLWLADHRFHHMEHHRNSVRLNCFPHFPGRSAAEQHPLVIRSCFLERRLLVAVAALAAPSLLFPTLAMTPTRLNTYLRNTASMAMK
jgi:hypothetical protein